MGVDATAELVKLLRDLADFIELEARGCHDHFDGCDDGPYETCPVHDTDRGLIQRARVAAALMGGGAGGR